MKNKKPTNRRTGGAGFIKSSSGYTIVELLIATVVFSLILLIISFGILQIGRTYYKGITETKTQQTARSIIDTISQDIQFNSAAVLTSAPSGKYVICIGQNTYTADIGKELVDGTPNTVQHQANHALLFSSTEPCGPLNMTSPPAGSKELLSPFMRITALNVISNPGRGLYTVSIRIVYGDDAVLDGTFGNCESSGGTNQFCSVAELSTTVKKRL